jgi:hypothetical protein
MNIWIKVKRTGIVGRIIGWCPDKKGRPQAMVQVRDRIFAFKIGEFRVVADPRLATLSTEVAA